MKNLIKYCPKPERLKGIFVEDNELFYYSRRTGAVLLNVGKLRHQIEYVKTNTLLRTQQHIDEDKVDMIARSAFPFTPPLGVEFEGMVYILDGIEKAYAELWHYNLVKMDYVKWEDVEKMAKGFWE